MVRVGRKRSEGCYIDMLAACIFFVCGSGLVSGPSILEVEWLCKDYPKSHGSFVQIGQILLSFLVMVDRAERKRIELTRSLVMPGVRSRPLATYYLLSLI